MPKVSVSKAQLWKDIRLNCLECLGDSDREVQLCTSPECKVYKRRFGRPLRDTDPMYIAGTDRYITVAGKPFAI
ncbi:MAG: hypothetical protein A2252_04230 [Elusimicrobia bacterium RIFOXYA2_FULL_39_19]|nr:MAG: hypothetical protein A2252_04230 [Elusimicrobia bacterium RIFOXYA2_FULL_39_19]